MNRDLASLYGASAPATDFASTQLPDNRRGILTRAAFLAVNAHPQTPSQVLRGKAVREQLLCDRIPAPPAGVERNVPVGVQPDHAGGDRRAHRAAPTARAATSGWIRSATPSTPTT